MRGNLLDSVDNIPNKLLTMAASMVSPSLTVIFAKSIETGYLSRRVETGKSDSHFQKRQNR